MTARPLVLLSVAMSIDGYIDDMRNARLMLSNEEDFDRVLAVNLKSCFLMGQAVAKNMVAQRTAERGGEQARGDDSRETGCSINMSSVNAILAHPNKVSSVVSKGGSAQLTKVMA